LLQETGKKESEIAGERIAFMVENGYDYVGAHSFLGIISMPCSPGFRS
jgi:hypothetical protein